MATPTRTLNPLPFEHLEHHRFEDLIRQLVYDFRPWRKLEATGRAGSDDGFDARGWEIVSPVDVPLDDERSEASPPQEEEDPPTEADRIWLVQCKRDKTLGPTRVVTYFREFSQESLNGLYGLLFAAPAVLSKRSRDSLTNLARQAGLQEVHIWGRGELEDLLFQPRNDHLLFAYFGISLQIRRRFERSNVRSRLAAKRKAHRVLLGNMYRHVLFRDPSAVDYPFATEGLPHRERKWAVRQLLDFCHAGIVYLAREYYAYISDDGTKWDAAFAANSAQPDRHTDPWFGRDERADARIAEAEQAWLKFPEQNRARLLVKMIVPYTAIADIDDLGDEFVEAPHVYASMDGSWLVLEEVVAGGREIRIRDEADRICRFPNSLRVDPDGSVS